LKALKDGTDKLSRNVGEELPLHAAQIPEGLGSHLHRSGDLK